jgi:hypothetical protein
MLSACGGGGSDDSSGLLSLDVTDKPVTEDVDVCIHFTSITLHHSDGETIQITYDPSTYDDPSCISNIAAGETGSENNAVNLSALQGELSVSLLDTEVVKAGRYNWIRLDVDESLSYVVDSEGQKDLRCPSCDGDQSGLKLNRGITVPPGGEAYFMIDVELNKSLKKNPSGDYTLRPTLRLVDMSETGKITGTVAASLIPEMISETDTGCKVYVYEGHNVVPDDYHDADNVLTSAKVLYDKDSDSFEYVAAFLPTDGTEGPSPYTVALTCDIEDMEVDQNNDPLNLAGDDMIFTDGITEGVGQNAGVEINQTTTVDFPTPTT